jgi:RNA polymerase sigma factor (sigma-70 family)
MDLPDSDVVAARTGDPQAFGRLVTRYRGLVSSISLCTVGNVAASEDVAQEVFLSAWRDLGSLRNPASFVPWLRQLTRHRALDALRSRRRPDRRALVEPATLAAAIDPRPVAEDALLEDERTRAVMLALDALSSDEREVITLYYREGQSVEQVARLLGVRVDTAKKRLSRARAALREEVLARFADTVDTTAPGDDFTNRVVGALPAMSHTASVVAGKWAAAAAAWSGFAGLLAWIPGFFWHRRDWRGAIDERERRQLRLIYAAGVANGVIFCTAVAFLPPRGPTTTATRMWLGLVLTIAFSAIHFAIYFVWRPRVRARRRQAEVLADPAAAGKHAREDRQARVSGGIAAIGIASVIALIVRELCR